MKSVRVLIVEDDEMSAYTIRKMLVEEGFSVVGHAKSGEDAIRKTADTEPDIILMDIIIEGEMDGVQATGVIHEIYDTPIIYLTGYTDSETIERAKRTAPFAYIIKPFTKKELAITIRMALYKNKLDRKLKESENRLSTILASIPTGVISTDESGNISYLNPTAEAITRCRFSDVVKKPLWKVIELRCRLKGTKLNSLKSLLAQKQKRSPANGHSPLLLVLPDSSTRIVQVGSTTMQNARAETTGHVIVLQDITEKFDAESRIRMMAAALESLEDAVVITDPHLEAGWPRIIYVNDGFENMTGWSLREAIGKTLELITGPKSDPAMPEVLKSHLRENRKFKGESVSYSRNDQEIITEWEVSAVHSPEGEVTHFVFDIRDITRLRRLEENIRQSQKIEAVGRLTGGIAHDFNNLLSVINSYADLVTLKLEEDNPVLKYVENIRLAGEKGADLVSKLMTFSRRDTPSPTILDLSEVTEEMKIMLRRLIRENIELETRYHEDTTTVKADQGQIEQSLINLCVNARDAMPGGGKILIEVRDVQVEEQDTRFSQHIPAGLYASLSVIDEGCGMEADTVAHIFDPFFTTKEIGKGTGLGLSTVYGIVKQLGGYIEVQSTKDEGSRFDLLLPSARQAAASVTVASDKGNPARGSECVLIVEDDDTFADCISGLLTLHGYEVFAASDGLKAIEHYLERADDFSLLISDIVLPKISGRELASRLLERNPDIKVIFMTGYDDELDTFYEFPNDSIVLQKPFSLNTLLSKVRELLDTTTVQLNGAGK